MSIEYIIKQIIELEENIKNDLDLINLLERDKVDFKCTDPIEDRLANNMNSQDKLKFILADRIVETYTGYVLNKVESEN